METATQQPKNKHLGTLLILTGLVVAWVLTPYLMGLQETASLNKQQLETQATSLANTLDQKLAQLKEYSTKSAVEKTRIIGAIPEKGKMSQANVLREIEGILGGTSAQLRNISFEVGNFSEGAGPKAIPLNVELATPDAGTILQILKKFEGSTRLYREEGMTLTNADNGVSAQLRLNVYSRE